MWWYILCIIIKIPFEQRLFLIFKFSLITFCISLVNLPTPIASVVNITFHDLKHLQYLWRIEISIRGTRTFRKILVLTQATNKIGLLWNNCYCDFDKTFHIQGPPPFLPFCTLMRKSDHPMLPSYVNHMRSSLTERLKVRTRLNQSQSPII